jgi:DNA primase
MENEQEVIYELLVEVLGDPKKSYKNSTQITFDCPICDSGAHKGNFEVNIDKDVYHCWACGDSEGTHGPLGKLFDKFGNKKQKKLYLLLRPEEKKEKKSRTYKLKLPEGFTKISECNLIYPPYKEGINYLRSRGITDEMCERYGIGLTTTGNFSGRVVIPSYDKNGELNYFVARSWNPRAKQKYMNPKAEKDKIIFNENLIDWEKDIYLCEGMFDAIFLPNAIPMLGKHLSELLFSTIYEKAKGDIIICLDGDAYSAALKLYHTLNGGSLYNRIKIVKLPKDKDVCDLRGQIDDYYIKIK